MSEQIVSRPDVPANVLMGDFYEDAIAAYDTVIAGEPQAKDMMVTLMVMGSRNGMGGILFGHPGTAKSTFLAMMDQVVEGYTSDNIAMVPHRADLTGAKLIGEETVLDKSEVKDGETSFTQIITKIRPIFNKNTKVGKFDEINRTGPHALNAALEILQDGGLTVYDNEGAKHISEFDIIIAAMNNYGALHTFKLDPALMNRFAMGAFMGTRERGQLSAAGGELLTKDSYQAKEVPKVITIDDLHRGREYIPRIMLGEDARRLIGIIGAHALDALEDMGDISGDGRLIGQIKRMSRTFALLTRKESVKPVDILTSYQFALTAKLGAIGLRASETAKEIESIFSKSGV